MKEEDDLILEDPLVTVSDQGDDDCKGETHYETAFSVLYIQERHPKFDEALQARRKKIWV